MKLGIKFGFVSTCIIALLIGSAIFFVSADVEDAVRQENHETITVVGEALAEELANPLLNGKVLTVQEIIDAHKERADYIDHIFVIDFEGRVAAHTFGAGFPRELLYANPIPSGEMHSIKLLSTEEGNVNEGAFRILEGLDAEVHIVANEERVESAVAATNRRIAAIGALFLLIGGAVTFFMIYEITRPLQKIVEGMEKIGEGDLDHRITVASRDEIGKLAASFNEMTGKRAEAEEALRESEEKYRTFFEDSRDVVYITSREGRFVEMNQSGLNLFGYTKEEMLGLDVPKTYVDPDDRKRFQDEIEKKGSVRNYGMRLKKKDGTEMDCLITSSIRRAGDGTALGYQGIIRDITERKRAEKELKQKMEELERINKLMVGRELKMRELKKHIKELEEPSEQP